MHNFVPESATFDTARGELTFTREGQQFVASPEYVLIRKDDRDYRSKFEKQVADETKQLSDKLAAIFEGTGRTWSMQDGLEQLRLHEKTRESFMQRIESELEEHGEIFTSFPDAIKPGMPQYDILSAELQSELKSWQAGLKNPSNRRLLCLVSKAALAL